MAARASAPAIQVSDILELVREHVRQQVEFEAGAQNGGVAKQEAIAGLEGVDSSRDQRLDGLRQRRAVAAGPGRGDELAHEQWVPAGALRDLGEQLLGETVPIDVSNPTVTVSPTYGFGQVAHAICADSGSGIAACNVQDPLDTSSVGTKTVPVHAEDRAGHPFDATLTYNVTGFAFTGFFSPVENLPTLNVASAGNSVPVKFGLAGYRGLDVFAQGYPKSQPIDCTTREVTGSLVSTAKLGFVYEPLTDWYKYTWKTEKSWRGTCRQLIVLLKDGTTEKWANFRFS